MNELRTLFDGLCLHPRGISLSLSLFSNSPMDDNEKHNDMNRLEKNLEFTQNGLSELLSCAHSGTSMIFPEMFLRPNSVFVRIPRISENLVLNWPAKIFLIFPPCCFLRNESFF